MKQTKEFREKMDEIERQMFVDNRHGDLCRARSITVGTCFGGTTEIMMRGNNGYMWTPLQPVEVIELIHQLAANVGCLINLTPRNDFSSWRKWRDAENATPKVEHAPFPNDLGEHQHRGQRLPSPEEQPGIQPNLMARSKENVVATEKLKNRRSAKRTAKAA